MSQNVFLTQSSFARERQRVIAKMLQDRAYETYRFNIQVDQLHAELVDLLAHQH